MSSGSVHGVNHQDISVIATAALETNYTAVKNDTAVNSVVVATANTDEVVGFIQQTQDTAGGAVPLRVRDYSLAVCSGGWTRGDKLTATTAGALVTTTTAAHKVCAIAEDTVSDGEIGEVRIISPAIRYDSF